MKPFQFKKFKIRITEQSIMVKQSMETRKEKVKCFIQMVAIMRVNGKIIIFLVLEDFFTPPINLHMQVIGKMDVFMVLASF